jgi:ABC exporter DevB family membrane fusion protein
MKRAAIIAAGALSLLLTAYLLGSGFAGNEGRDKEGQVPVVVTTRYVAAEGKVEALPGLEIELGTELIARVERFFVGEGDRVEKGQTIAALESSDVRARLKVSEAELQVARARLEEAASGSRPEEVRKAVAALDAVEADLALAEKELERHTGLYREGLTPDAVLEEKLRASRVAKARVMSAAEEKRLMELGPKKETIALHQDTVRQAEASVEYWRMLLEKTLVKAPISGTVLHRYLDEGEIANPETPLAAIADTTRSRINAEVDETDIGRINIGDRVDVTSDAFPGRVFKGEISEIAGYVGSREIRPNNNSKNLDMKVIKVKVELKEPTPFKLGMTVDVRVASRDGL